MCECGGPLEVLDLVVELGEEQFVDEYSNAAIGVPHRCYPNTGVDMIGV